MEYRLLGPLEVRNGETPLRLGGAKQRALLALLLLGANRVVARDRLVDGLWGESPPDTAVATIQVYVSRLRKLLPEGTLLTRPPGYLLAVESDTVDLQRFERLVGDARDADPTRGSELLHEALALWRGRPLAEFDEEPFARAESARLEETRLAALEQRIDADLALGGHARLIAELEALAAEHPQRERLQGQLMLALYRSGRQADALSAYRRTRAALHELGLEPGAGLRQLERQILTQDAELDLAPERPTGGVGAGSRVAPPEIRPRRKTVTVVFCDLAGSTVPGGSRDPEATRALMARCVERMIPIVEAHGGTAESLIGDTVVAVFGTPVVHEDDVLRSLRAAEKMRDSLLELGVEARIGVNTGEVVANGHDALVSGDAVNLAARLQRAAASGEIVVGAATRALAGAAVEVEDLELLEVDGTPESGVAFRLVEVGEAPRRLPGSRFVGRTEELALLRTAWMRAAERESCELVTIVGEPGVGKSRLVAEFVAGLDARVVEGRCLSYGEGITYFPIVEVIRQLNAAAADPAVAGPIGSLLGESEQVSSPDEIAWAFRKLLEQESPLLVVFDDIQWGEETFLDSVEHIALLSAGSPLLLLCLARPELLERRPRWPVTLPLEPLPAGELEALLPETMPASLRARIARAAGGNPLFVTEMVAMAAGGSDEIVVPATLKALLAARLDRLEEAERAVLERGALEGELFHRGAVEALAPSEQQVTSRLAALVRKALIRPDRPLLPAEDGFRFCHLLIRDAAYDGLAKATRAELHERLADWLDQHGADLVERNEIVGYHLEQAHRYRTELGERDDETHGLGERAATRLSAGGRRASVRGDHHAVANLLERALALGLTDSRRRVGIQLELGKALFETGRIAESEALLTATRDAAASLAERGIAERALVQGLRNRLASDPTMGWTDVVSIAEGAITTFEALGDTPGLAEAEILLAGALHQLGRTEEAFAVYDRALRHAEAAGATEVRREAIARISVRLCTGATPVPEVIGRLEQLLSMTADDRVLRAAVRRCLSFALTMAGDFESANAHLQASTPVLDEADETRMTWSESRWFVFEARELMGDEAGAEEDLVSVWLHFRDTRGAFEARALRAAAHLALLCCDQGRWDEAAEYLAYGEEVDRAPPVYGKVYTDLRLAARARVAARRGDVSGALELARTALDVIERRCSPNNHAQVLLALAEVQRAAGNTADADAAVLKALELYERKGNVAAAARVRDEYQTVSPASGA